MKNILLLLLTVISFNCFAQNEETTAKVYDFVETMPEPGYDFQQYLANNVKYPESAIVKNIQGRVIVKFVITEDGFITGCEVIKGIGGGCDEEALRVIKNMPPWKPGTNKGKNVSVFYNQPISFKLAEPDTTVALDTVVSVCDTWPKPKYSLTAYFSKTMRYPVNASNKRIQGKPVVKFVVNKQGAICNCEIAISAGAELDEEALRIIKNMPPWEPGIKDGKPVNCLLHQPVSFKLNN